MNSIRPLVLAVACVFALAVAAPLGAAPQAAAGAPKAEAPKSLYWQGHEALSHSEWNKALEQFRALERELAKSKSEPADAAIYWQAYALTQAKRTREAAAEIDRLEQAYPDSPWIDDAQALAGRAAPDAAAQAREQDALMALDALLSGGSSKAVPMLQRVLAGTHSDQVKGRAIFVLSQIDAEAAEAALDGVLRGNASTDLKAEAIRMIAAGGRSESLDRLLPLYREITDDRVRDGVLDAFLIGDRGDLILKIVETEADADRRERAIEKLGAMGASEALSKLYASRTDRDDRRAVLRAFGVAGDRDALVAAAQRETDPQLKAEAIRSIGIAGGKDVGPLLLGFVQPGQPEEVANAVLEAMTIAGTTTQMIEMYRKETDPDRRHELLQRISATDADAALELIDEVLDR